jgi:hypothetical protein
MRNIFLSVFTLSFVIIFSQQNLTATNPPSSDSTKLIEHKKKIQHEIGVNSTYLIKQLFSSNNYLEIQPYQLTYKLIKKNWALRSAFGFNWYNNSSDESIYDDWYYYAPDNLRPSYNTSTNVYGRLGWEYRFHLSKKIIAYSGIDIIAESFKNKSETQTISNNLPYYYYFESSDIISNRSSAGIGPVLGIQFFATKRLSIFTEIPIYFIQSVTNTTRKNYTNTLSSSSNTFVSSNKTIISKQMSTSSKISLPATIYVAIKF